MAGASHLLHIPESNHRGEFTKVSLLFLGLFRLHIPGVCLPSVPSLCLQEVLPGLPGSSAVLPCILIVRATCPFQQGTQEAEGAGRHLHIPQHLLDANPSLLPQHSHAQHTAQPQLWTLLTYINQGQPDQNDGKAGCRQLILSHPLTTTIRDCKSVGQVVPSLLVTKTLDQLF